MSSIAGKRIALIGGAGFIGHNLAISLKREGADVSVIDSLQVNNFLAFSSTNKEVVNRELYLKIIHERLALLETHKIPLLIQDAREYHQLSHMLAEIKPDVIVMLAAVAHADRSNKDPFSTFDHSLRTLENALDFARGGVGHFIFFSSSMVYGNFASDVVTEETICSPLGIYGALKYAGEKMVIAYNQVFNLPFTIVRPSALYGERCVSRRVGQIFIENALKGVEIKITGDGSDRLDFTYIHDLVHGVKRIIENDKAKGEIFNITYGSSRSISDMATILKEHFSEVRIQYLPKDTLMPSRGTLSVEKAKRILGYYPEFPLEKGFTQYIEWYKSFALR